MRLSPSDSRKRSSSSTRTICGGGTAALSMLVDELLKTALGALLDNVIASDFIVESPHYPVLKVEVKIDVDFAILAGIVPDRGRRRLGPGSRRAEPVAGGAFVEADDVLGIDENGRLGGRRRGSVRDRRRRRLACRPRRGRLGERRGRRDVRLGHRLGRRGRGRRLPKGAGGEA